MIWRGRSRRDGSGAISWATRRHAGFGTARPRLLRHQRIPRSCTQNIAQPEAYAAALKRILLERGHELNEDDRTTKQIINHLMCNLEVKRPATTGENTEFETRMNHALAEIAAYEPLRWSVAKTAAISSRRWATFRAIWRCRSTAIWPDNKTCSSPKQYKSRR